MRELVMDGWCSSVLKDSGTKESACERDVAGRSAQIHVCRRSMSLASSTARKPTSSSSGRS